MGFRAIAANSALATGRRDIAVIGCGAIGLTTALQLQRSGTRVPIYAKDRRRRRSSLARSLHARLAHLSRGTRRRVRRRGSRWPADVLHVPGFLGVAGTPVGFIDGYGSPTTRRHRGGKRKPTTGVRRQPAATLTPDLLPNREFQPGNCPFGQRYVRRNTQLMFNLASCSRIRSRT